MQRFVDLNVWQRAHRMTLAVYRVAAELPREERYGLISQVKRAAVSIEANIAEGSKRKSRLDYARILNIAEGSAAEVECLFMVARDLNFVGAELADRFLAEADEIGRMLNALRASVEKAERTTRASTAKRGLRTSNSSNDS